MVRNQSKGGNGVTVVAPQFFLKSLFLGENYVYWGSRFSVPLKQPRARGTLIHIPQCQKTQLESPRTQRYSTVYIN
jgi:hypothetical protein